MTTSKYKKMLMSCGIDRNLAEEERQIIAQFRGYDLDSQPTKSMNDYKDLASVLKKTVGGSLRGRIKHRVKFFRDAEMGVF